MWSYRTVQQSTTPLAVHRSLRLAADQGMWRWDGPAQVWRQHSPTDASFASHALVAGDTLAFRDFPVDANLVAAKLGSIDHDTRVTLYHGWNIIPAGGSAIRAEGENGDWFLNRYFINCGQSTNRYAVNGVFGFTKVLVYDAEEQTFALEIPCDQALETRILESTTNPVLNCQNKPCSPPDGLNIVAGKEIDRIRLYDPLYVEMRTNTPIRVIWRRRR